MYVPSARNTLLVTPYIIIAHAHMLTRGDLPRDGLSSPELMRARDIAQCAQCALRKLAVHVRLSSLKRVYMHRVTDRFIVYSIHEAIAHSKYRVE